jgi:hypothetical protein
LYKNAFSIFIQPYPFINSLIMPDSRKHRGQHPADSTLFSTAQQPKLSMAIHDLSWLLGKGYSEKASVKLVGDRYRLKQRQRMAIQRVVCTEIQKLNRQDKALKIHEVKGRKLLVDGLNLLITIESALSNGLIFEGLDGTYRDLASVHGTYKKVEETPQAMQVIGETLTDLGTGTVTWLLDKPVSNSGRIKKMLCEMAQANNWPWEAELVNNPDTILMHSIVPIVSSDSLILDHTECWFNLSRYLIDTYIPDAQVLRFDI